MNTRDKVTMPTRAELRKAMHTLDLAICAAEDMGSDVVPQSQSDAMRDAYEVLDWFTR